MDPLDNTPSSRPRDGGLTDVRSLVIALLSLATSVSPGLVAMAVVTPILGTQAGWVAGLAGLVAGALATAGVLNTLVSRGDRRYP